MTKLANQLIDYIEALRPDTRSVCWSAVLAALLGKTVHSGRVRHRRRCGPVCGEGQWQIDPDCGDLLCCSGWAAGGAPCPTDNLHSRLALIPINGHLIKRIPIVGRVCEKPNRCTARWCPGARAPGFPVCHSVGTKEGGDGGEIRQSEKSGMHGQHGARNRHTQAKRAKRWAIKGEKQRKAAQLWGANCSNGHSCRMSRRPPMQVSRHTLIFRPARGRLRPHTVP